MYIVKKKGIRSFRVLYVQGTVHLAIRFCDINVHFPTNMLYCYSLVILTLLGANSPDPNIIENVVQIVNRL